MKILLLDNYDSFTYNLYQLAQAKKGASIDVLRNDDLNLDHVSKYDKIILSPGPGIPSEAGLMMELLARYKNQKDIFGVCLGMQAIAEAYGAELYNLENPLHGVSSIVEISDSILFSGIPKQFEIGHYHSWAVLEKSIPLEIKVTAKDSNGVVMAIENKEQNIFGVQFHPESILTQYGQEIMLNFLGR